MIRLLHIEWIKLWHNRWSKLLLFGYLFLLTSIALIAAIRFDIGPVKFHLADQGIFNFPYIWHFNTFIAAWMKLFLAIIIVSMTANEYSYKTIKQNLIDGLSHADFLKTKVLMVLALALASTLLIALMSGILGGVFSDYTTPSLVFQDISFLAAYYLKLVAFFSFCLFAGVLVKRSAFALGFIVIWQIFEGILTGLLYWKAFKNDSAIVSAETAEQITSFFPLVSMYSLIKQPFTRLNGIQTVAKQVGETFENAYQTTAMEYLIAVFWTALFIWGTHQLLKRRDL
ncbi:MAG: ABC transporter permease [Flavobacteriaceae bacterium]|jgi:ABC-2 type transport system permease protein|nr:ABC transporter permease [Flavobacteriaceae bacterium]MDP4673933.1 ABC transporter permease [Flavobacteriaceae bacterium]MDP4971404.1 ABC transporter permease [Flavobacteriaceae bacterium]MDP5113712.1 ABC transporter permease [Flavobacteriaceae bacterium]